MKMSIAREEIFGPVAPIIKVQRRSRSLASRQRYRRGTDRCWSSRGTKIAGLAFALEDGGWNDPRQ